LEFFIDIKSFRSHYGPGVDSASNRNEYHEHFLGGKGDWCVRLTTYHHPLPLSQNLGTLTSWNILGHSRPVTGLPYLLPYKLCRGTSNHAAELQYFTNYVTEMGDRGGTAVKVLCYKSEGHWFDSRWCHWNFSLTY